MNTIKFADMSAAIAAYVNAGITPLFLGAPGIGKTAAVHQYAEQVSINSGKACPVRVVELASFSEVDVRGYLIPNGTEATFTTPSFWPKADEPQGVLFLDEFPQADAAVQKAVASLLLERRIGDLTLPDGWCVVAAGNRVDDGAGANTLLSHIVNRLALVEVESPTIDELVTYLVGRGYGPEVPTFVKLRGGELLNKRPEEDNVPYCTPRSVEAVARLLKGTPGLINSAFGLGAIAGLIGSGPATELKAALELFGKLPSYNEIVSSPDTAKVPEALDLAYAAIMLVTTRAKLEHADPVVTYVSRFEPNVAMVGMAGLLRRDPRFFKTAAMSKWATANSDVVVRLSKFMAK